MREVFFMGYRVWYEQRETWVAYVVPLAGVNPLPDTIIARPIEGANALLRLARAHIEEHIIDVGGRFLDG